MESTSRSTQSSVSPKSGWQSARYPVIWLKCLSTAISTKVMIEPTPSVSTTMPVLESLLTLASSLPIQRSSRSGRLMPCYMATVVFTSSVQQTDNLSVCILCKLKTALLSWLTVNAGTLSLSTVRQPLLLLSVKRTKSQRCIRSLIGTSSTSSVFRETDGGERTPSKSSRTPLVFPSQVVKHRDRRSVMPVDRDCC